MKHVVAMGTPGTYAPPMALRQRLVLPRTFKEIVFLKPATDAPGGGGEVRARAWAA